MIKKSENLLGALKRRCRGGGEKGVPAEGTVGNGIQGLRLQAKATVKSPEAGADPSHLRQKLQISYSALTQR